MFTTSFSNGTISSLYFQVYSSIVVLYYGIKKIIVVFRPSLVRKLTIDDNELRRLALW